MTEPNAPSHTNDLGESVCLGRLGEHWRVSVEEQRGGGSYRLRVPYDGPSLAEARLVYAQEVAKHPDQGG